MNPMKIDFSPDEKATPKANYSSIDFVEDRQEETPQEFGKRTIARTGARGIETAADVAKSFSDLLQSIPENVLKGPLGQKITEALKPISGFAQYIPEQEKIKEFEKEHFGDYLEPKTKGEKLYDEVVQDTTALFMGPQGRAPFLSKMGKNALISILGAGAKTAAEEFGAEEKTQGYAKLGTMLLTSMWNPGGAEKYTKSLYAKAKEALPEEAKGNASSLERNLKSIQKEVSKGTLAPSEEVVRKETELLLNKIKDGELSFDEAVASRRSLNEKMNKALYDTPKKEDKERARKLFGGIKNELSNFIGQSQEKYPEFYKAQKMANESFATIQQAKRMERFFEKHHDTLSKYGIPAAVFKVFTEGFPFAAKATAVGSIGTGVYKAIQVAEEIRKSPALRKYYFDVFNSALKEDSGALIRNMKEFVKESQKKGINFEEE